MTELLYKDDPKHTRNLAWLKLWATWQSSVPCSPSWAGSLSYRKERKVAGKQTVTVSLGQVALLFTYMCTWLHKFYLADNVF